MTPEYRRTEWDRAADSLRGAEQLLAIDDFDGAASRAYYAAFHAVSALFAHEGRCFTRHGQVRAAVHRDLVKTGRWQEHLGRAFDFCVNLRGVGDYGTEVRVSREQAAEAVDNARHILNAVRAAVPVDTPQPPD